MLQPFILVENFSLSVELQFFPPKKNTGNKKTKKNRKRRAGQSNIALLRLSWKIIWFQVWFPYWALFLGKTFQALTF